MNKSTLLSCGVLIAFIVSRPQNSQTDSSKKSIYTANQNKQTQYNRFQ